MRLLRFTFKNEAVWMLVFSIGVPIVGLLILLCALLLSR